MSVDENYYLNRKKKKGQVHCGFMLTRYETYRFLFEVGAHLHLFTK